MKKKTKKIKKKWGANVMEGFDEKGELIMRYWQKEPFTVRRTGFLGFKVSWWRIWKSKLFKFLKIKQTVEYL